MSDAPPLVAFDESGATGANLLDEAQPVLAIGSICMPVDDVALAIDSLRSAVGKREGEEFHLVSIRSPRTRSRVLEVLANPPFGPDTARAVLIHKRFAAVTKMVDLTLEPLMYEDFDYDMYGDRSALATANLLFLTAPALTDKELWDASIENFVRACRDPNQENLAKYTSALVTWAATADELHPLPSLLSASADRLADAVTRPAIGTSSDALDPALPLFISLARSWGTSLGTRYAVTHDASKILSRWLWILKNLDLVPDLGGSGMLEPLPIIEDAFEVSGASHAVDGLQLADCVAGSIRTWATALTRGRPLLGWEAELREVTSSWVFDSVWPDPELLGGRPEPSHQP